MALVHKNDGSIPLRLRYPAVFDQLLEMLKLVGLNANDVISEMVGPTSAGEVTVHIHYGQDYLQCTERTFYESSLTNLDAELLAFLKQVAKDCQQRSIADYRTFMGRDKP